MSRETSAGSLVAEGFSRIADAVGVVLLGWLGWRMFFVFDSALQGRALVVGVVGMLACWTDRSATKNAPLAMLAYVAIGLLSAATHRWSAVASTPEPAWLSLFTPATHLAVMAAFIYGAAYLLRTPARRSWFVVLLGASMAVLATQIAFDRASSGFVYERSGFSLPSVPHWGGIHGASLFLTLGLPLTAAIALSGRSLARVLAAGFAATGFLVVEFVNGSRGGLVAMGVVIAAMSVFAAVGRRRFRSRALVLAPVIAVFSLGVAVVVWLQRAAVAGGENLTGRTLIWSDTARLILDHPWLGVGPGNYSQAITDSGYAQFFIANYGGLHNAHNMYLHVSAESGVIGAGCLIAFLVWALWACWRSWVKGNAEIVSLGIMFALLGFLVHSGSENFLDARAEVERTRLLVWMILAAALALHRLSRTRPREPV